MNIHELKRILKQPEDEHIEYKAAKEQYDIKKLMRYCKVSHFGLDLYSIANHKQERIFT